MATTKIRIEREIVTAGGARVSVGIVGRSALYSFADARGMEIVCVRGKRKAAKIQDALRAHESADFWTLRHAAFAAKAAA